jgi:hypothetical protein
LDAVEKNKSILLLLGNEENSLANQPMATAMPTELLSLYIQCTTQMLVEV